ncbi:MAG: glycine cleavage system aminomethyltransferase GcvT, partial [Eggerthellaceae bacterium]|nr:glycine cleavage system aminomethyltransferase GcvT [Eggerthellaceae bacterium]
TVKVLEKLSSSESLDLKYYCAYFYTEIQGNTYFMSHTGYTSEDGFKIYHFN